jgi:hypothetical protein
MKIFEYKNFQLSLNIPEILLIPEFKEVLDSDKSKDKTFAFKIFTYGYLLLDWNSPFREYSDEDRKKESLISSGLNEKDIENELVKRFTNKYEEILNSNRIIRSIKSTWTMLDKLDDYANTVDLTMIIESGPNKGKLVHSVKEVRDTIKQMEELILKAKNLRNVLKEEMQEEGVKSRGNNSIGYFNG